MASLRKGLKKAATTKDEAAKAPKPERKKSEGKNRYLVRLMDGGKLGAVVDADSKADAKEAFTNLCGIRSTEHPINVTPVEDEDIEHLTLDENGVVTAGLSS